MNGVVLTEPWHEAGGTGGNAESGLAGEAGVCRGWRATGRQAGRQAESRPGRICVRQHRKEKQRTEEMKVAGMEKPSHAFWIWWFPNCSVSEHPWCHPEQEEVAKGMEVCARELEGTFLSKW